MSFPLTTVITLEEYLAIACYLTNLSPCLKKLNSANYNLFLGNNVKW